MEAPKKAARTRKSKSLNGSSAMGTDSSVAAETGPQALVLPADLRIGMAKAIYEQFRATSPISPLVIDASAVAKVDAAGMQAVLAGIQLRLKSANWSWQAPAESFTRAARLLGLHQLMALPA